LPDFVRFYKTNQIKEVLRVWHSATRKVAFLFFPVAAFLLVFATDAVTLIFSPRYLDSTPVFRIFLLLLPLRMTVYGSLLIAAGKSGLIFKGSIAMLLFNAVLMLALVPTMGLNGAALSVVIAVYVWSWWLLHRSVKLIKVRWAEVFPWGELGKIALVSIAAGVVAAGCTFTIHPGIWRLGLGGCIFAAVFAPLAWFFAGGRAELGDMLTALAGSKGGMLSHIAVRLGGGA
jgi:O-antigen/teichoic acid export membrane protein